MNEMKDNRNAGEPSKRAGKNAERRNWNVRFNKRSGLKQLNILYLSSR